MKTLTDLFNKAIRLIRKKSLRIEKRYRFVITTVILSLVMVFATFPLFQYWFIFVPLLFLTCYALTYFSILEDVEGVEWFGLFLMPVIITISFYFFYFLFPARWLTRLPFIGLYAISIYAILLCSNIFNVGVEKNLQLYRAAFSVNFFYHALSTFFIFNILFSFQQIFLVNAVVMGIMSFILSLQFFWTIRLNKHLDTEIKQYAFLVAGVLMQLAIIISFLPLKTAIYALFLTASYYSLSGLIYNYMDQRLFKETIREYFIVLIFVGIITTLSLSW